ncbi:hypothetical protein Clacol_000244 [Clathrus columnatus]|uniref:Uncharacterized protein n=1 Tax=Clathrus columnatus TaxID=1419009 RepID=A0AAV4ZZ80_9AGAM|nr:hypothetical protein Clacol_000244 [Clathrus columnatus]
MASKQQRKPLPLKEQALFKELLALYESRTLKRALKTADQILKKIPDHGDIALAETMCMKGLVLTHMNRKEEGMDLVKKGLVYDMQSHICWHVLGIIKKADKNWDEALKAYMQAVRCDKENMNLLRDAAQLQVHLGIYDGFQDTRWQILKLRPNLRQNWIAYALACHLNSNLVEAKNTLRTYFGTLLNIPDYDVEHSEVLLYYLRILEELGEYSDALAQLDLYVTGRSIVDKVAIAEIRARLLSKLNSMDDALQAWRALIDQNPDCHRYYTELFKLQGIDINSPTTENYQTVVSFLQELTARLPRIMTPRRLLLAIMPGRFLSLPILTVLIGGKLHRENRLYIRPLYVCEEKRALIEQIVESLREDIEKGRDVAALHHSCGPYSSTSPFPDPERSLSLLERAIEHTPTLPELYMGKAKILKIAGDPFNAARAMEEARRLDGQDRYLNWKAAKYLMRAGNLEEATRLLGIFTKKDAQSPGADLEDMQCFSYMLAEGDAHFQAGRLGLALRRFKALQMTFDDIENDQFDFHNYSLRKSTINTYLDLMSFEKRLRDRPTYTKAAIASSKIYVRLYDDSSLSRRMEEKISEADKKAKKKAKKAAQRGNEENKRSTTNTTLKEEDIPEPPKYDDPEGLKLLTTKDPLGDAMKWLKPLQALKTRSIEAWFMIYDVTIRKQKLVQALQALITAWHLDQSSAELHVRIVDYHIRIRALPAQDTPTVALLAATDISIPPEVSLETYNNEFIQKSLSSAKAILAGARVSQLLGSPLDIVEGGVFELLSGNILVDVDTVREGLHFLSNIGSSRKEEFRERAKEKFPLAVFFGTAEEIRIAEESLTQYMGTET